MQHPFQCLACVENRYLLAACGSQIVTHSLDNTGTTSVWSSEATTTTNVSNSNEVANDGERPTKKQKTAKPSSKAPKVIKITVSPDQRHVIAVTDDKYVRVLEHQSGRLTESSQRCMPKRPCAIQVLPNNATILVGDKFGDVYALPLIAETDGDGDASVAAQEESRTEKAFKPSATNLTVHSQRNLKALEAQKKQKDFTPRKDPLKFKHSLLLGHVSMLTDMKYLVGHSSGRRGYIVTADRDEHIRVSRGPPQAYVIEGFCLGHTQYLSKICQIGESNLLVSGGGDDWLGVWNWVDGTLVKKIDMMSHVRQMLETTPDYHLAVSGIWAINAAGQNVVVVAYEGVKALFFITQSSFEQVSADMEAKVSYVDLINNPLDVVQMDDKLIVSMDSRQEDETRLVAYIVELNSDNVAQVSPIAQSSEAERGDSSRLEAVNARKTIEQDISDKDLDELLYGVAKLRKRGPLGGEEAGDGNEAVEDDQE